MLQNSCNQCTKQAILLYIYARSHTLPKVKVEYVHYATSHTMPNLKVYQNKPHKTSKPNLTTNWDDFVYINANRQQTPTSQTAAASRAVVAVRIRSVLPQLDCERWTIETEARRSDPWCPACRETIRTGPTLRTRSACWLASFWCHLHLARGGGFCERVELPLVHRTKH